MFSLWDQTAKRQCAVRCNPAAPIAGTNLEARWKEEVKRAVRWPFQCDVSPRCKRKRGRGDPFGHTSFCKARITS